MIIQNGADLKQRKISIFPACEKHVTGIPSAPRNPHDNYSKLSLTCHKSRACYNLNVWKNYDVTIGTSIVIYSKWCGFCTSRPPACPPARPKISIFCAKRLVSHHAHGPPQHSRLGLRSPTSNAITIVSLASILFRHLYFFFSKKPFLHLLNCLHATLGAIKLGLKQVYATSSHVCCLLS